MGRIPITFPSNNKILQLYKFPWCITGLPISHTISLVTPDFKISPIISHECIIVSYSPKWSAHRYPGTYNSVPILIAHPIALHFYIDLIMFLRFFLKFKGSLFREHIPILTNKGFIFSILYILLILCNNFLIFNDYKIGEELWLI